MGKNATYTAASVGVAEVANNSAELGTPAAGTDDPKGCSTRTGGVMQGKADVKMVDNEALSPIAQWRVASAGGGGVRGVHPRSNQPLAQASRVT